MNILNKLTIRSLLLNKKRTLVTIIGIILSCALICGVTTLVTSFQSALYAEAQYTHGNYHTEFQNVPVEDQKYFKNHVGIEKIMLTQDIGYAKLENSENEYKPYVYLMEFDDEALNNLAVHLVEGRLPENENEIVISQHIITDGGVKLSVGQKITLDVGKRMDSGHELDQGNPYNSLKDEDETGEVTEYIDTLFTKEYTIVGIMERPNFESYSAPGYTIISHMDQILKENVNIFVSFKNVYDTYDLTAEILGMPEILAEGYTPKYEFKLNYEVLRYSGMTQNSAINSTLYSLSAIIIGIIVVTSVFVIRNSFSISITERFRQYGMLASVGATSKQIKKNVLFEGFILGLIAIPIGVLSGIFAIYILLLVVNGILGDLLGSIELVLAISPIAIIITILISAITIFLSSYLPARKVAKISPLEAIRSNNDIKVKSKKLKISKLSRKLFGIEGEIALKNLKRSKKKYRTTILSIALSIIVFISLNTFVDFGFLMGNVYYENLDYNIYIYNRSGPEDNEEMEAYYQDIIKLPNITKYAIRKEKSSAFSIEKYFTPEATETCGYYYDENGERKLGDTFGVMVISFDNAIYQEYLNKLGLNATEYKEKGILIDQGMTTYEDENGAVKRKLFQFTNIKEGEFLEVEMYNNETEEREKHQIQIGKRTDQYPFSITSQSVYSQMPIIIISDEYMEKFDYRFDGVYIDSSNATQLEKDIEKLPSYVSNTINNIDESVRQENAIILVISIFLYGFITVISLIGITNIFNTITTNMSLRHREFAVLKSIGMTDKEFRKMINFESIFYGLKALLYGIPIGCILSYAMYQTMLYSIEMPYHLPYNAILISIIFVVLIVWCTMRYSLKKAEKLNIVDTIRNENI